MADALSSAAPQAAAEVAQAQVADAAENPANEVESSGAEDASLPPEAAKLELKKELGATLTKKEEQKLKEYKLKVNGREKTIKFDPSNDEEMVKYLQKAESSDSKFAEAAEVRKAAMQFIDELKKNPKKVLSDPNIGVDLKKFAEEIMNEAIQEMEKSPEQREREKMQKELEELRSARDNEKKTWEQKELARMQAEHERHLETEISAALDIGGLPKTARTVRTMADMMIIALENGIELSAQEIAPIVKDMNVREFKEIINSLGDDQLEDFLGKEVLGRLRKRNVAKSKVPESANSVKATGQSDVKKTEAKTEPVKKQTIRDFLKI